MTASRTLRLAKAHIADPEMWYKGDYSSWGLRGARNGVPCCGWGALEFVGYRQEVPLTDTDERLSTAAAALFPERAINTKAGSDYKHYPSFNDHADTTHDDVMKVFDRAIANAEFEEKAVA